MPVRPELQESRTDHVSPVNQNDLARYTSTMRRAMIAPILLLTFGIQVLLGGTGSVVVCIGGGHEHGPTDADHCASACSHDTAWPIPMPTDEPHDDCACRDIELQISATPTLPRIDLGVQEVFTVDPEVDWSVVLAESGLGRRGPPLPPPDWFDPSGEQRIKLVSSTVLNI